jgi:hypothetical protein
MARRLRPRPSFGWETGGSLSGPLGFRACVRTPVQPQVGNKSGQATKGAWGMSRRQEAMKGVEGCDKPGGTVKQVLIPGFPNDRMMNP